MLQNHSVAQAERPLVAGKAGMNENWLRVFDAYSARFLVLKLHSESDMVKFFRSQPGWSVDFEDGEVVIFVRDENLQDTA